MSSVALAVDNRSQLLKRLLQSDCSAVSGTNAPVNKIVPPVKRKETHSIDDLLLGRIQAEANKKKRGNESESVPCARSSSCSSSDRICPSDTSNEKTEYDGDDNDAYYCDVDSTTQHSQLSFRARTDHVTSTTAEKSIDFPFRAFEFFSCDDDSKLAVKASWIYREWWESCSRADHSRLNTACMELVNLVGVIVEWEDWSSYSFNMGDLNSVTREEQDRINLVYVAARQPYTDRGLVKFLGRIKKGTIENDVSFLPHSWFEKGHSVGWAPRTYPHGVNLCIDYTPLTGKDGTRMTDCELYNMDRIRGYFTRLGIYQILLRSSLDNWRYRDVKRMHDGISVVPGGVELLTDPSLSSEEAESQAWLRLSSLGDMAMAEKMRVLEPRLLIYKILRCSYTEEAICKSLYRAKLDLISVMALNACSETKDVEHSLHKPAWEKDVSPPLPTVLFKVPTRYCLDFVGSCPICAGDGYCPGKMPKDGHCIMNYLEMPWVLASVMEESLSRWKDEMVVGIANNRREIITEKNRAIREEKERQKLRRNRRRHNRGAVTASEALNDKICVDRELVDTMAEISIYDTPMEDFLSHSTKERKDALSMLLRREVEGMESWSKFVRVYSRNMLGLSSNSERQQGEGEGRLKDMKYINPKLFLRWSTMGNNFNWDALDSNAVKAALAYFPPCAKVIIQRGIAGHHPTFEERKVVLMMLQNLDEFPSEYKMNLWYELYRHDTDDKGASSMNEADFYERHTQRFDYNNMMDTDRAKYVLSCKHTVNVGLCPFSAAQTVADIEDLFEAPIDSQSNPGADSTTIAQGSVMTKDEIRLNCNSFHKTKSGWEVDSEGNYVDVGPCRTICMKQLKNKPYITPRGDQASWTKIKSPIDYVQLSIEWSAGEEGGDGSSSNETH